MVNIQKSNGFQQARRKNIIKKQNLNGKKSILGK